MTYTAMCINGALDVFFDHQRHTRGRVALRRLGKSTIAASLNVAAKRGTVRLGTGYHDISVMLQSYRLQQAHPRTTCDYRIACRGYGRASRWYVLTGPGLDIVDSEIATLAHAMWIVNDLYRRAHSDSRYELLTSAATLPNISGLVNATVSGLDQSMLQTVSRLQADVDFYTQVTGTIVEMIPDTAGEEDDIVDEIARLAN